MRCQSPRRPALGKRKPTMSERQYRLMGIHDTDDRPFIELGEGEGEIEYSVHRDLLPHTESTGLEDFSTYELCREMERRYGINVRYVRPYEKVTLTFDGPVVVFANYT